MEYIDKQDHESLCKTLWLQFYSTFLNYLTLYPHPPIQQSNLGFLLKPSLTVGSLPCFQKILLGDSQPPVTSVKLQHKVQMSDHNLKDPAKIHAYPTDSHCCLKNSRHPFSSLKVSKLLPCSSLCLSSESSLFVFVTDLCSFVWQHQRRKTVKC